MRPGQVPQHRFVDMGRLIVWVPQAPEIAATCKAVVSRAGRSAIVAAVNSSGSSVPQDDAVDAFPVAQTGHDGRELLLRSRGLPSRWTLSIAPGHAGTRVPAPHPVRSEAVE